MDIRKYFNAPGGASNTKKHAKKTSKSDSNLDQSENVPEEPRTDPVKSKSSKRVKEDDSYSEAPKKKQPKTDSPAPESKEKEIPEGAENCLLGKTFVFTGDLESLSREDAQDLVKRYGGKVTLLPSSRTTYVVVGDNPGPKKLEKIKQHNIPTLTEDELLDLIRNAPAQQSEPSQPSSTKGKSRASDVMEVSEPIPVTSSTSSTEILYQLWSDKYKPKSLKEVCGNKSAVENLQKWLKAWESNLKNGFNFNSSFPAVLISGPPGIGKTTAAHLVGKLEGYDVKEFNASDTRSKKALEMAVKTATRNTSIMGFFRSTAEARKMNRTLIIMDEVDGMSAGDRGGVAELVQLIKKTQVPIICICNEKGKKLQSLTNVCQDIRFQKPRVEQVRSRIMTIASREKLKFNQPNIVDEIITGANADIRQILNRLSSWKLSNDSITYDEGKALNKASEKNVILDPFDITSRLFGNSIWNNRSGNLNDKLELYYHESDILPLMIQENYLKIKPQPISTIERDDVNPVDLEQIALLGALGKAAVSISDGDLCYAMIHGSQPQWTLMPIHGMFSCVIPTYYVHGSNTSGARYAFPSSLGQTSKTNKYKRILKEIQIHMRLRTSGDKNEIRQSYLPALFTALSQPLIDKGADGIIEVIELMDQYYLNKEDWDAIMELSIGGDKILKEIDKPVKAAFTRKYNSSSHPVPFLKASSVKSSKAAGSVAAVPDFEDAIEIEQVVKDEDEFSDDDDLSKDKFIKQNGTKTRGGRSGGRKAVRKLK